MEINDFIGVKSLLAHRGISLITFVNPFSYYLIKDNRLNEKFDFIFCDAISLVWLHNLVCRKKISRYSFDFTSIANNVFSYSSENSKVVAIVGGTSEEAIMAQKVIEDRFENCKIVAYGGFFNIYDSDIYNNLNDLDVDIVISGMGTPLQERFLLEIKSKCPSVTLGFTCGGFISQIASSPDYFNSNMNKLNLRWLQRALRHDYVRRRLLKDYPKFFFKYLFDTIKSRIVKQ